MLLLDPTGMQSGIQNRAGRPDQTVHVQAPVGAVEQNGRSVYPLAMVEVRDKNLKTSSVSDWFQIVASIGVLAGLLLVGYELNRNEGINIGNLSYQSLENLQNYNLVVVGENPMASLTKACLNPDGLSEEDYFVLDALYSFRTADIRKLEILSLRGDYDIGNSIDGVARHHASEIASTMAGRAWLEANMSEIPVGMQPHAEKELKDPTKNCHAIMSGFISRTQQMSDLTPDESPRPSFLKRRAERMIDGLTKRHPVSNAIQQAHL